MSAEVVNWISCELSKLLGTDADHTVARHASHLCLFLHFYEPLCDGCNGLVVVNSK